MLAILCKKWSLFHLSSKILDRDRQLLIKLDGCLLKSNTAPSCSNKCEYYFAISYLLYSFHKHKQTHTFSFYLSHSHAHTLYHTFHCKIVKRTWAIHYRRCLHCMMYLFHLHKKGYVCMCVLCLCVRMCVCDAAKGLHLLQFPSLTFANVLSFCQYFITYSQTNISSHKIVVVI